MSNLKNNTAALEALIEQANALPEEKTIQSSKTVTPTTSSQTVKPDSGYDGMGQVVVNAMPTATLATPTIEVTTSGTVRATVQQNTSGYIESGIFTSANHKLTTQAAKTITPTKSSQTAVASGLYTTGTVTVAAIPDEYQDASGIYTGPDYVVSGVEFVTEFGRQVGALSQNKVRINNAGHMPAFYLPTDGVMPLMGETETYLVVNKAEEVIGTTVATNVLAGETFTSIEGLKLTGTMPNNGSVSQTIDGLETKSATIPAGYTTGGTVSLDSTIDNTANSQADLIAQISEALEGKSVSGGEEDVTAEVTAQTTLIDDLEAAVEALPDAGNSGVETCTVVLKGNTANYRPYCYSYTTIDDSGNIVGAAVEENSTNEVTLSSVVCGSVVTIYWYGGGGMNVQESYATGLAYYGHEFDAYMITAPANGTATLTNDGQASGGGIQ